ncbi:MAG: adenosine-specific kinase [bacterium]
MELKKIKMNIPTGTNIILGQTHFIKTIEDLYEIMVGNVPNVKFGISFCEASGPCLVRSDGNEPELIKIAEENALNLGAGHIFIIIMRDCFPINVLNALKQCQEVCAIYCATANPVEVLLVETEQGRGVIGVVDGFSPKGIENEKDKRERTEFLRKLGYKR